MIKIQDWFGRWFKGSVEERNEKLRNDAHYLLQHWPRVDEVPDDMLLAAFGLAAYLQCKEWKMRENVMKEEVGRRIQQAKDEGKVR